MLDNVIFYNHYGNGDLFISREFVKEIMKVVPAKNYLYAHAKNPRMFADIPNLGYTKITDAMQMRSRCAKVGNDVLINTWLGVDSTFVTRANSCSIYNSFRMFNYILMSLGYTHLSQPLENYLPSVDYSKFDITPVDEFVKNHKDLILICNCQAQSGQAENFDMTPVIQSVCNTYPNMTFVVSDSVNVKAPNYVTSAEVTKSKDGFDLNEISYLSTFSNLIVGRSSGFQIFSMTKENCMNPKKGFLSFTRQVEAAHIVWQTPKINAKVFWSNMTRQDEVYKVLCRVIEEVR